MTLTGRSAKLAEQLEEAIQDGDNRRAADLVERCRLTNAERRALVDHLEMQAFVSRSDTVLEFGVDDQARLVRPT